MESKKIRDEELERIWKTVNCDRDGARALKRLKEYGWDLGRVPIGPQTWSGITASVPLSPNRRARSYVLRKPQAFRSVISFLDKLVGVLTGPYNQFEVRDPKTGCIYIHNVEGLDLRQTPEVSDFLTKAASGILKAALRAV
jgi:hypothetical protein